MASREKFRQLQQQNAQLRRQLAEAGETLAAIRSGDVDAVVVNGPKGEKIYSLQEAENLYRRLTETIQEPMLALNHDGAIVFFNRRLEELLAYPPGRVTGRKLRELVYTLDRVKFDGLLRRVRKTGSSRNRVCLVSSDGNLVPVYWRGNLLGRGQGKLICLVGSDRTQLEASRDYTEQLEVQKEELLATQQELVQSRENFAELYESAPAGHLTLTRTGWILNANPAASQIFGVAKEKLVAHPLMVWLVKADRQRFLKHMSVCVQRGEMASQFEMMPRNGAPVFLEMVSKLVLQPEGQRIITIVTDITERKRTEIALRESEARFRTMADFAPVMIWVMDKYRQWVYVNKPLQEFTGMSLEEDLGAGYVENVHPEDLAAYRKIFDKAFAARKRFETEYRLRRRDGAYRWLLVHAQPRFGPPEQFLGFVGSCIDITERKEMEAALELASQLPKENPSPVLRLNKGRVVSFQNPAAEALLKRWKVSLGDRAPARIMQLAMDSLKRDERITVEQSVGNNVYQILLAPVRKGGYVNLYFSDITERKRSERALQESEVRFRTLADNAPVGIFMSKVNGDAIYLNKKWGELAGLSPEQSLGKKWLQAVHPEDRKDVAAGWQRAVGRNFSSNAEFRFQRPNGAISWIHGHATRLPKAPEGDIAYIGTTSDITERKQAEESLREANELLENRVRLRTRELTQANAGLRTEIIARRKADLALREGEQRLRLMIEGTHDYAFFMLDRKGRVATWNSGAAEIKGYRAKEILGKHFSRFYTPSDVRNRKPQWLLEIARATGRAEDEGWRLHKNGAPFWASVIISALRDSRGRLRGYLNVTRDITEQRKMQEVLETSRLSLENFFEESPFGLFWVSPQGEIQRINKAGCELLGARREDCLNLPISSFWVDQRFAALALSDLGGGKALQSYRARFRAKDGTLRHVLIDASSWKEKGRLLHTRWFVRDISRRVELEREILAVAESERRRIGRDLHDDLCQQLTGLEFLSQTLASRLRNDQVADKDLVARAEEISRTIRIAITHARDLSHGLAPSVLDSGGLQTALEELVQRARKVFRIDCRFRARKENIKVDEGTDIHLYRIAQEAVGNAIKHGRAKRIDIGLTQNGTDLVLAVKDFGVGLPAKPADGKGIGLRMMQYRAGVIGGTLLVQRNLQGGTTVACTVHGPRPNGAGQRSQKLPAPANEILPADSDL